MTKTKRPHSRYVLIRTPGLAESEQRLGKIKDFDHIPEQANCTLELDLLRPDSGACLYKMDLLLDMYPPDRTFHETVAETGKTYLAVPYQWYIRHAIEVQSLGWTLYHTSEGGNVQ